MEKGFIALDWGSSNCRAYQIDGRGAIVDQVSSANGVAKLSRDQIPGVLSEIVGKWPDQAESIYCCGMIGSTIGWANVPYIECPISPEQFAGTLPQLKIGDINLNVSPGLKCRSIYGQPDIMRGEEMQYLGYLYNRKDYKSATGVVCMPGTHSKWLAVEAGTAKHFSTAMTGDIFAAMSSSGLLKTHLTETAEFSQAFIEGIEYAKSGGSLARHLFSVRSRVVTGELENSDATSYASGILIGSEICDALAAYEEFLADEPITLIGSAQLSGLYQQALTHLGKQSTIIDAGVACIDGFKLINELKGDYAK